MSRKLKKNLKNVALILGVAFVAFMAIPQVRGPIAGIPVLGEWFAKAESKIKA